MNKDNAYQLATNLLELMRSGNDARTQVEFICNSMRIKKKNAAELQKIFESGVNAGLDSVICGDKMSFSKGQNHPLYVAAYHLGRDDFKRKLDERRNKPKAKKGVVGKSLILFLMLTCSMIIATLLARFFEN